MRIVCLVLPLFTWTMLFSQQSADTIRPGMLHLKYLPEGTQSYLVYIRNQEGQKRNIWLWERSTGREQWNGLETIVIRQHWATSDTGFNSRQLISVTDAKNFTPLYHYAANPKTGVEAYDFRPGEIITADTVTNVGKKGFRMTMSEPSFNWELDLETFSLLPLKEGKTFIINFYHPGSKTGPAWYKYTVTGTEVLKTVDGKTIDCYKLYTKYGNNRGNSTWWLSKKSHEVLKMEEHFGPVTRFKLRLSVVE